MTDIQKRAVGYVRVSTTAQVQEGESLETQKTAIATYYNQHNLELVETFLDEGISGRKQDRPGLIALLDGAKQRKFDYVIVTRLTRFGRSTRDLVGNLGILDDNGVRFVSLKENIDTSTPAGRLLRIVLIGIAEFESDVIKDQMLENRGIRAKRGDIIVGKPPFGYQWNKEKKEIEVNPQEAEIYRRIVDMYLYGKSYKDITVQLRREGVKAKKAPFSSAVVGQVLKSRAYLGRLRRNTHKYAGNRKLDEMKPEEQHYVMTLPPLIKKSEWDKIQAKIAFNKVKTKRITNPNFWLRNVLVCGECGGAIKPKSMRGKFDYYQCYWSQASPKELEAHGKEKKCCLPSIPAQALHNEVDIGLSNFLTFGGFIPGGGGRYAASRLEKMVNLKKYDEQITELAHSLIELKRSMGRKETAKENLFSMLEESGVDRNLFRQRMEVVGEEIRTLEAQIEDTQQKLADLKIAKANHEETIAFIKGNRDWLRGVADQIKNLAPQEKQKLIESMLDGKIEVFGPPEPGDDEYNDEGDENLEWILGEPSFIFNPGILDKIEFNKFYNHQSGAGGRAQGWHRLRPAGGGGHPGGPGPAGPGASGKASVLRGVVPGRPFETDPGGAVHGPGYPGGGFGPDHLQGERAGGRGGPGGRGLCRGEPGPGGGTLNRPASPGPGGAGPAGPGS